MGRCPCGKSASSSRAGPTATARPCGSAISISRPRRPGVARELQGVRAADGRRQLAVRHTRDPADAGRAAEPGRGSRIGRRAARRGRGHPQRRPVPAIRSEVEQKSEPSRRAGDSAGGASCRGGPFGRDALAAANELPTRVMAFELSRTVIRSLARWSHRRSLDGPELAGSRMAQSRRRARSRRLAAHADEEVWRYTRIAELDLDRYSPGDGATAIRARCHRQSGLDAYADRAAVVVVHDGRVVHVDSRLSRGLFVGSARRSSRRRSLLGSVLTDPTDVFAELNDAFAVDPTSSWSSTPTS